MHSKRGKRRFKKERPTLGFCWFALAVRELKDSQSRKARGLNALGLSESHDKGYKSRVRIVFSVWPVRNALSKTLKQTRKDGIYILLSLKRVFPSGMN